MVEFIVNLPFHNETLLDAIRKHNKIEFYALVRYCCLSEKRGLKKDQLKPKRWEWYTIRYVDLICVHRLMVFDSANEDESFLLVLKELHRAALSSKLLKAKPYDTSLYPLVRRLSSLLQFNLDKLTIDLASILCDLFVLYGDILAYQVLRSELDRLNTNGFQYYAELSIKPAKDISVALSQSEDLFLKLYTGDIKGAREIYKSMMNPKDLLFDDFIRGKSIAVVGPADDGLRQGSEIDSFDLVYRINSVTQLNPDKFGSKNDILWLNAGGAKKYGEIIDSSKNVSWIVTKLLTPIKGSRQVFTNRYMINNAPNSVQFILYDLLLFEPSYVKLFNANCYATKRQYSDDYEETRKKILSVKKPVFKYNQVFVDHDLISNFRLIKIFYKHNYIDVDPVGLRVLQMSEDEYLRIMSELYPPLYNKSNANL